MYLLTLLACLVVLLSIVVIIVERRTRSILDFKSYHTQMVIPCSTLLLTSRRYTLFKIPMWATKGTGVVTLSASGTLIPDTEVKLSLYGLTDMTEPIVMAQSVVDNAVTIEEMIEFEINDGNIGNILSIVITTSIPCTGNYMSDILATLSLYT